MRVPEGDTDLGGGKALTGELGDVLDHIIGGGLEPGRGSAAVREGRGRYQNKPRCLRPYLHMFPVKTQDVQMPFPGACMRPMIALRWKFC